MRLPYALYINAMCNKFYSSHSMVWAIVIRICKVGTVENEGEFQLKIEKEFAFVK